MDLICGSAPFCLLLYKMNITYQQQTKNKFVDSAEKIVYNDNKQ